VHLFPYGDHNRPLTKTAAVWDGAKAHPENVHTSATEVLRVVFSEPINVLLPILSAPVTAFAVVTADSEEVLEETCTNAKVFVNAIKSPTFHGFVIGKIVGSEHRSLFLGGWDSAEVSFN